MKEFTQTALYPRGNCWQTAVACILEVDPIELPSQFDAYTQNDPESGSASLWSLSYNNVLQAYLRKHHGLAYVEFHWPPEAYHQLEITGYHIMTGTTVRSADYGGIRHVVVGLDGKVAWDPHPSRAGLLDEIQWAVLAPFPKSWERGWGEDRNPCVCPRCKSTADLS